MKHKWLALLAAVIGAASMAVLAAPTASAATTYPVNQTVTIGTTQVTITGTATVVDFTASGSTITATVTFGGTVTVTDTTTGASLTLPVNVTLTATVSNINADCASGTLTFDVTATLTLTQPFSATYTLGPTTVTINAGGNRQVRNLICQVDRLLANGASSSAVVDKLDVILKKAA